MSVDPDFPVKFKQYIVISQNEPPESNQTYNQIGSDPGQLRFNRANNKFEGFHGTGSGSLFGNGWRPLTQDIATASNLGIIKVGTNLTINSTTGVLSSIASGVSRYYQLVITVSPIPGAADFQDINTAISSAIGTPAGGYMDGTLTSNLGSPPSAQWPFVIQLGPGQYSYSADEQITLPDYVSILGEGNRNSIVNLTTGNTTIQSGSLMVIGDNALIRDITFNIDNPMITGNIANIIYCTGKSNVIVDNCTFTSNSIGGVGGAGTLDNEMRFINMISGNDNVISNNQFFANLVNSNITCIHIESGNVKMTDNMISINSANTVVSTGISLVDCGGIPSLEDIPIIDNCKIYNNYGNTLSTGNTNSGIILENTPAKITNSIIECNNDPTLTDNYAVQITGTSNIASITTTGIISLTHNSTIAPDTINSNNTGICNFITAGFLRGQWISITGTTGAINDGLYKITAVSSNSIQLDISTQSRVITEAASGNTITIKALYSLDINNSTLAGSTNAILESTGSPGSANYIINLENVNIPTGENYITSARINYTNYKTITIGAVNCNYTNLTDAMATITDATARNPYLIQIESGIYQEPGPVICREYVNITGNGVDNTILQFYTANTAIPVPDSGSSALVIPGHVRISNLTVKNTAQNVPMVGSSVCSIYCSNNINGGSAGDGTDIILEDIKIESACGASYNYGIYGDGCDSLDCYRVDISINQQYNSSSANYGILLDTCSNITCNALQVKVINSVNTANNYGIYLQDSTTVSLINPDITVRDASTINTGVYCDSVSNLTDKLVEIAGGYINASTAAEYSIYADNYYTVVCNGVDIRGDTFTNAIQSRIVCNGSYTFTGVGYAADYQSLNSRGQNEQALGTITIGDSAGRLNSTGRDNLIIGVNAGNSITSGSYNTFLGANTGSQITTSNNNTLIGSYAGRVITTGIANTILGSNAGINLGSGSQNIITGFNAAVNLTSGRENVLIGSNIAPKLQTSNTGIIIGQNAAAGLISGDDNILIGGYIAPALSNGAGNTWLGTRVGLSALTSNNTVLIGRESGYNNQVDNITAVGSYAGYGNTTGIKNTFLGYQAGYNTNSGSANTILGNKAGAANIGGGSITGNSNTLIGSEAGFNLSSGSRNILIGSTSTSVDTSNDAAGWSLSNGTDNIMIGVKSGSTATSAINNVLIGSNAGGTITTAGNSVLIGKETGAGLNTVGNSVIIGAGAGNGNTGGNAVLVGYNAGAINNDPQAFAIGYSAGYNVSGVGNMFMGYNSGGMPAVDTTGDFNIAIGPYTGYNLTSGARNVMIGSGESTDSCGRQISTGTDNTLMGFKAGRVIQSGSGNTLIGSNAGAHITAGINNLVLGHNSAFNLNTGSNNISMGSEAGYNLTTGEYNIFTGYQAGFNTNQGDQNINVGYQAGYTAINNNNNIHLGTQAGYLSQADNNIFVGKNAGIKNTTGANNLFMGTEAGSGNNPYGTSGEQTGNFNIFMGYLSGNANYNGTRNIYMGYQAGRDNQQGAKNIFIGDNAGSEASVSHNIFIGSASDNTKGVGYQATGIGPNVGEYNVFIGHDVGIANTTGAQNIFLGDGAGFANTTGENNIYIGNDAGRNGNAAAADDNIAIGRNAGKYNESGYQNILIGKGVASLTTSTDYIQNIIIGANAGQNIQQDNQIFIGTNAGQENTTGDRNIFIGLNAGQNNVVSKDNIVIGSDAGVSLVGNAVGLGDNVIIGTLAGHDLTSGINNIFIGSNVGANTITANNCVAIGTNALANGDANDVVIIGNEAGTNNTAPGTIAIGYLSGNANTIGQNNLFIGAEAGRDTLDGSNNIMMGIQSGLLNTSGTNNIYVGEHAAAANNGSGNIAMGPGAMQVSTTANINICIGQNAGYNTNGNACIFIGSDAGKTNQDGFQNIAVGYNALGNCSVAAVQNNNIAMGYFTGYNNAGTANILMGYFAGYNNQSNGNIFVGYESGLHNIQGAGNICFGAQTGLLNTTGNANIYMGAYAGYTNSTGSGVIAIGTSAGYHNLVDNNIFIGVSTGYKNTTGNGNVFMGYQSGYNNLIGNNNLFLGYKSGYNNTTNNNIFIGNQAGYNNTSGTPNICIGYQSGYSNQSGLDSICIGNQAGYSTTANYNIYIGSAAGYNAITGEQNICIGTSAGYSNDTGGFNIYFGFQAGFQNQGGIDNIILGANAGFADQSGNSNILIGPNAGFGINGGNDNIYLGNQAGYNSYYSCTRNILIGAFCGFNVSSNTNNTYIGYCTAQRNSGNNNVFIGYETTKSTIPDVRVYTSNFSNKFGIYRTTTSDMTSNSTAQNTILFGGEFDTGRTGVGTIVPSNFIGSSIAITDTKLVVVGKVLANAYTLFTGSHQILPEEFEVNNLKPGMIMSSSGDVSISDINNTILHAKISVINNDKAVFGVFSSVEIVNEIINNEEDDDIHNIANLNTSNTSNISSNSSINLVENTSNATIIYESRYIYYVNSVGEGGILVSNMTGEIQNGDYITSSTIPGYGCLQADDLMHSYTVAKCTQYIDWANIPENILCPTDGNMYKSLLVACTYHCG